MSTENQHEDRWLCRQSTHDLGSRKETANIRQTSELVWGHWVHPQSKHGNPRIVGESYHELHGPTACASISAYAEDLNMRGVKPSEMTRCVADGGCKKPKSDPNQMGFVMMVEPDFKRGKKKS